MASQTKTTETQADLFVEKHYGPHGYLRDIDAVNAELEEVPVVATEERNMRAYRFADGSLVYQIADGHAAGELLTQRHLDERKAEDAAEAASRA